MTCPTFMVHLDLDRSNDPVLNAAAVLAEKFDARMIGVAAWSPLQFIYTDGYIDGAIFEQDRADLEQSLKEAEAQFRAALKDHVKELEWRSALPLSPSQYVAEEARGVDLVILDAEADKSFPDNSRRLDSGEFVMRLGRPVLIVPHAAAPLRAESILVAWKDAREARRATLDALPLLMKAARVTVAEISKDTDDAEKRVADVAAWLRRHGAKAEHIAVAATGKDSDQIDALARQREADVVVAGAYGHSRLREWVFGGVTRDLLQHPGRYAFLSH